MKTLIFSDIHHRTQVIDQILADLALYNHKFDRVVYLGDFFDNWSDNPIVSRQTAIWVKEKLEDEKNVMLLGNHDWAYYWPKNGAAYCSGFDNIKSLMINEILTQEDWEKFKIYHVEQGLLLSHAGISERFIQMMQTIKQCDANITSLPELIKQLDTWIDDAKNLYKQNYGHRLFFAGRDRGGSQPIGGIIWDDLSNHIPLKFVNQIVGHTIRKTPDFRLINKEGYVYNASIDAKAYFYNDKTVFKREWTLGLDTSSDHFAILEDGMLDIYPINIVNKNNVFGKKLFTLDTLDKQILL